jgi:hypothetical protein
MTTDLEDTAARRATIFFELAAVADRYTMDQAPESHGERLADLLHAVDRLQVEWSHGSGVPALREVGGLVLSWLEDESRTEQQR